MIEYCVGVQVKETIQITKKSRSNRALEIRLNGPNGYKYISGKSLRKKLQLLSTKFEVNLKFSHNLQLKKFETSNKIKFKSYNKIINFLAPQSLPIIPDDYFLIVKGFGAGHGVGMSQWGAKSMAERGSNFREILKHYYSGIQIKSYYRSI